jgi:hypothetical protein
MKSKKKIGLLVLIIVAFSFVTNLHAQVTIGKDTIPNSQAVLELRSGLEAPPSSTKGKGLLLPRVALNSSSDVSLFNLPMTAGLAVYNTGTAGLPAGIYYWDGTGWLGASTNWFYMPSFPLDVEYGAGADTKVVDLKVEFRKQFFPALDEPTHRTPDAPSFASGILDETYNFYIIGYDAAVFSNVSIDAAGKLHYTLIGDASDATYMNIVMIRN